MSRHERQLARHRANWVRALKFAKCPKDGGKILEINMPDVVCNICSTRYSLAIQVGTFRMSSQLIEQKNEEKTMTKEKEITKEKEVIVKIRCSYCHNLYDESLDKCPHCGGRA